MHEFAPRTSRRTLSLILLALLVTAGLAVLFLARSAPSALARSTHAAKPVIKDEEVGYFGSATVAHSLSVFVYTNVGPRAGDHVTVCVKGTCKRAVGHAAATSWYEATFSTRPLPMGARVTFSAMASDAAGRDRVTVTKGLLCMHNNGSTPQT